MKPSGAVALAVFTLAAARTAVAVPRAPEPPPVAPSPPDEDTVEVASNANLDPVGRHGIVIDLALGPKVQWSIGDDVSQAAGIGGVASARVGMVASPRWIVGLAFDINVVAHNTSTTTEINQSSLLTVDAQVYLRPSLWIRFGAGVGSLSDRDKATGKTTGVLPALGSAGGLGVDLVRTKKLALEFELFVDGALYRGGDISMAGGFGLGLAIE